MKIRSLFIISLIVIFAGSGIFIYAILKYQSFKILNQTEIESLQEKNEQIINTLQNEFERNEAYTKDWANWDETYAFMENYDPQYVDSNFSQDMIIDVGVLGMLYLTSEFKPYFSYSQENQEDKFNRLTPIIEAKRELFLTSLKNDNHLIFFYDSALQGYVSAIIYQVTLTHDLTKSNGYVVTLEYIDEAFVEEIGRLVGSNLTLSINHNTELLQCRSNREYNSFCQQVFLLDDKTALLKVSGLDSENKTYFEFTTEIERSLHLKTQQVFRHALMAIFTIGVITLLFYMFLIRKIIVQPITSLADSFRYLALTRSLTKRIDVKGPLEIRLMTESANLMLKEIEGLKQQLENLSRTDELTGVSNRRYFREIYEEYFNRSMEKQTPLSILMVDIDYFKQYNDNYGHIAGDECLKQVAAILKRNLKRSSDFIARYGGEEFIILFLNTSMEEMKKLTDLILQDFKHAGLKHEFSLAAPYITCSLGGVSHTPQHEDDLRIMLSRADELLYQAKEKGRNTAILQNSVTNSLNKPEETAA